MNTPEWYEIVIFILAWVLGVWIMSKLPGVYGGKKKRFK